MDIDDERTGPVTAIPEPQVKVKAPKRKKTKVKAMSSDNSALLAAMLSGKNDNSAAAMAPLLAAGGMNGGMNGIWPIALLALLGRGNGGLFGGNGDGAGVATAQGIQSSIDTNAILGLISDTKAAVPLAEAQVQLALATQSASITNQLNTNTNLIQTQIAGANVANLQGQTQLERALGAQTQFLSAQVSGVATQADRNLYEISKAITADGAQTRALITDNLIATLNQQLTTSQNEVIELRNENNRGADRHGIEINMLNNQNQNQLQFQQQQQSLNALTNSLFQAVQAIHATNQAINIGGTQLASPTNTNTNVQA